MEPLIVLVAPASVNLAPLTQKLWAERIPHRVIEDDQGQQCLLLANPADIPRVQEWLELWRAGGIDNAPTQQPASTSIFWKTLFAAPLSLAIVLLVAGSFVWMHFSNEWLSWLRTAQELWPQQRFAVSTYFSVSLWEWWRPVLLHFSLMHILFNSLWLWILAPRIERLDGKLPLLVLLLLGGLVGNMVQWWYAGPAFGGISGVTMAMLGWAGLRLKRVPYQFPPMMLPVMVGLMVLTIGFDTLFSGLSGSAHGAHIGGLITGMLLSQIWPVKAQNAHSVDSNISRGSDDS